VGTKPTTFHFAGKSQWVVSGTWAVEGVHVKAGAAHAYIETHSGRLDSVALGGMRPPW
jgi:hypothetical protein